MILKCIRTVAMAALAMVSINVSGQDLLARQAPIDRKLKAVDSLALIRQIKAEQAVYPAYSLYQTGTMIAFMLTVVMYRFQIVSESI